MKDAMSEHSCACATTGKSQSYARYFSIGALGRVIRVNSTDRCCGK